MIITDRFVYIHQPKTGGTFVTAMIERLYELERPSLPVRTRRTSTWPFRVRERYGTHPVYGTFRYTTLKHDPARTIPRECRRLPILGTIRNPFDHYVSQYRFGWWRRDEFRTYFESVPDLRDRFPGFPDLEFPQWFEVVHEAFGGFQGHPLRAALRYLQQARGKSYWPPLRFDRAPAVGLYTADFVSYFARHPRRVLSHPSRYEDAGRFRSALFDIHFLRMDDLNRELHDFLKRLGYAERDIEPILHNERVLPTGSERGRHESWRSFYTPELIQRVRRLDRIVLAAFPDLDVAGDPASAGAA